MFIRQMQIAHDAEGRFVRDANVANFARALELRQRVQRFEQRDNRSRIRPAVAQLAEAVGRALRPVNLIQIQIVGLQAFEAVV